LLGAVRTHLKGLQGAIAACANTGTRESALTVDEMLDNIALYWFTNTAASGISQRSSNRNFLSTKCARVSDRYREGTLTEAEALHEQRLSRQVNSISSRLKIRKKAGVASEREESQHPPGGLP
jgi:hypothetical protein